MLSKKEIEKAKEQLRSLQENAKVNIDTDEIFKMDYEAIETILKYIDELEMKTKKQNKIIDEMLTVFVDNEEEFKCSECCYECERDRDTLYQCNKQYFEEKVGKDKC